MENLQKNRPILNLQEDSTQIESKKNEFYRILYVNSTKIIMKHRLLLYFKKYSNSLIKTPSMQNNQFF